MTLLTGRFETATGAPVEGTITFTPVTVVRGNVTVVGTPITASVTGGNLSVTLVPTNDGTNPTDWAYKVDENWVNGRRYYAKVTGATMNTTAIAPLAEYDGVIVTKGDTGSQGPVGPIGPQGVQGPQGATGPKGDTGSQGPQGIQGVQGVQGPIGLTGSQGPAGLGAPPSGYPVLSTNYVVNPSLENGIANWGGVNGATMTRQADAAIEGSWGARISAPANGIADSGVSITAPTGPVLGKTYTVSVSVRAITGGELCIYSFGSLNNSTKIVKSLAPGQVWRFTKTTTAVGTGAGGIYVLRTGTNKDSVVDFDVDLALVEEGSTANTYFDGNTPGARWTGTQYASTSELITTRNADLDLVATKAVTLARYYEGTGSPVGVVNAPVGARYVDTASTNGAIEWISTAPGTSGWAVVFGDTGWRNISANLINGYSVVGGSLLIRRTADTVTLRAADVIGTSATADGLTTTITGFRISKVQGWSPLPNGGLLREQGGQWQCVPRTLGYFTATWITDDAWPTTLPGTAA